MPAELEEETIAELIPFRKWRLQDAQEDFDRALQNLTLNMKTDEFVLNLEAANSN